MLVSRGVLPLLAALCLAWAHPLAAQSKKQLNERQIDGILVRAESLLARGQALQAIRAAQPVAAALFTEESFSFPRYSELSDRLYAVAWVAVVRLAGVYDVDGKPAPDEREVLNMAQARLHDLLPLKNPVWTARHAEALVALGDRMPEAYTALSALHEAGTLSEPEGYAAFTLAARATGHDDDAHAARSRCVALAKRRSRTVCPK